MAISITITFLIFFMFILSWQVYSLNEKENENKSYLLEQRIKWIDRINSILRNGGFLLAIGLLIMNYWQCAPGVFILGYFMSFYVLNKQEQRKQFLIRLRSDERDMASEFESTEWYNIEQHINKK